MIDQAVLEAGAKALYETRGLHRSTGREWDHAVPGDRYTCERDARAVLEAASPARRVIVLNAAQIVEVKRLLAENTSKLQAISYLCKALGVGPIRANSLVKTVENPDAQPPH